MVVQLGRDICGDLQTAENREWLITNGIGGYGAGTVAGLLTRRYHGLRIDDADRPALRAKIVTYLDAETTGVLTRDDYDETVRHFAAITDLLAPKDLQQGEVPSQLERLAERLVARGNPRGDEARVLSGLLVLHALARDGRGDEYDEVSRWGRDSRGQIQNPLDRYTQLVEVWDEHARLTPAPDVLARLAALHVERRDAVVNAFRQPETMFRGMSVLPAQILRIAPLDVAGVFLRHGDIETAITQVEAMSSGTSDHLTLLRVLKTASRGGADGADALVELAEAFRSARPAVARGVCRRGMRDFSRDARFAGCLARVAAAQEQYVDATAWYAKAIELAPDVQSLYDEALSKLGEFIQRGLYDDTVQARVLARDAEQMVEAYIARFPTSSPAVTPAQVQFLHGMVELHAGDANAARERFEQSIALEPSKESLAQLAMILERTDQFEQAARKYREALDRVPNRSGGELERAEIIEHIGDAFRQSGDASQAERMYRQALASWERVLQGEDMPQNRATASARVRRGVLLDRLGRHDDAKLAFAAAMNDAPRAQTIYAQVLAHLVTAEPDPAYAHDVFRRAQREITLAPEWRVYFAMWVQIISGRADQSAQEDITSLLQGLAEGSAWFNKLASFATGQLDHAGLMSGEDNIGHQTEAHFYEGARLLRAGDTAGANQAFEQALAGQMLTFFEYSMAQALRAAE